MRKEEKTTDGPIGFIDEGRYVRLVQIFEQNGKHYACIDFGVNAPSLDNKPGSGALDKEGNLIDLWYDLTYPELLKRERTLVENGYRPSVTRQAMRELDQVFAEQARTRPQGDAGGVVVAFPSPTPTASA